MLSEVRPLSAAGIKAEGSKPANASEATKKTAEAMTVMRRC